jgi:hypothetical protein
MSAGERTGPTRIAVVYQSGGGHTRVLATAVADGARSVPGVDVSLSEILPSQVVNGLIPVSKARMALNVPVGRSPGSPFPPEGRKRLREEFVVSPAHEHSVNT